MFSRGRRRPVGLRWRCSLWYVTWVVGLGVMTDALVYSIVIPVLPFQLERLGYDHVSGLTGWLLFAYSAGLVVSTPPIAMLSEKYNTRLYPLLAGQIILLGSQVMLMEAPTYAVMVIARVIQGVASSVIWVVGLALLCDTAHESVVGTQLGVSMSGLSVGFLLGPVLGGVLFRHFGFRGPLILAIIITVVDLIGRLFIIERKDALEWGVDPTVVPNRGGGEESQSNDGKSMEGSITGISPVEEKSPLDMPPQTLVQEQRLDSKTLSLLGVVRRLGGSARAVAVMLITMIHAIIYSNQEPTLPLHLQAVWQLDSTKVGLVFLAGIIPSVIASPLSGWFTDRWTSPCVILGALILELPFHSLLIMEKSLAFFIAMFCFHSFFNNSVLVPLVAELAIMARIHDGVGFAHVYGAFNLSFGVGAAIGPVLGGQIYDHAKHGWLAICLVGISFAAIAALLSFLFVGSVPLSKRLLQRRRRQAAQGSNPQSLLVS